jgi:hypothetical protein
VKPARHIEQRLRPEFAEAVAFHDLFVGQYRIFNRSPGRFDGAAMACIPCVEADAMTNEQLRARVVQQWTEV